MSLYDDLGVAPDADHATIKAAYRSRAQRAHPDKPTGSDKEFQAIQIAYSVLSDDAKRKRYDRTGRSDQPDMLQQAMNAIGGMFLAMVDNGDIEHDDMVAAMKVDIAGKIAGFRDAIVKAQSAIKKQERVLKRIKHTGKGKNILAEAIRVRIGNLERGIAADAENIVFAELVATMLEEYGYEVDEMPMRAWPTGGNYFSIKMGGTAV